MTTQATPTGSVWDAFRGVKLLVVVAALLAIAGAWQIAQALSQPLQFWTQTMPDGFQEVRSLDDERRSIEIPNTPLTVRVQAQELQGGLTAILSDRIASTPYVEVLVGNAVRAARIELPPGGFMQAFPRIFVLRDATTVALSLRGRRAGHEYPIVFVDARTGERTDSGVVYRLLGNLGMDGAPAAVLFSLLVLLGLSSIVYQLRAYQRKLRAGVSVAANPNDDIEGDAERYTMRVAANSKLAMIFGIGVVILAFTVWRIFAGAASAVPM